MREREPVVRTPGSAMKISLVARALPDGKLESMIDNCPVCEYSSAGHPVQHRCPECGLEYESDAVLFAEPRWCWWTGAVANALVVLTVVIHWAWRSRGMSDLLIALPFAIMCCSLAWHLGRTRHFVLVSPRTIRILGREEEPGGILHA